MVILSFCILNLWTREDNTRDNSSLKCFYFSICTKECAHLFLYETNRAFTVLLQSFLTDDYYPIFLFAFSAYFWESIWLIDLFTSILNCISSSLSLLMKNLSVYLEFALWLKLLQIHFATPWVCYTDGLIDNPEFAIWWLMSITPRPFTQRLVYTLLYNCPCRQIKFPIQSLMWTTPSLLYKSFMYKGSCRQLEFAISALQKITQFLYLDLLYNFAI